VCRGRIESGDEGVASLGLDEDMQAAIDRWIARGKLGKLADLWVRGLSFDWGKLHGRSRPRRIGLPTYPFARERYWIEPRSVGEHDLPSGAGSRMQSIENIIEQLDEDLLSTEHGVRALRMLV
jgi:polyketide synthase PksN